MSIAALRTPDDRFANLPDFPYEPHYVDDLPGYEGLRMAYVDEGPRDGAVFLCLHGEPSWSFLYRKMIPVFTAAGGRVVAPDFYGFGRSDKPTADATYTWDFHRGSLVAFIERLDLTNATLVCQDWGGLLGLTLPMDMPQRITRMLVMNTALGTGLVPPSKGFEEWKKYVASNPDFDVAGLMKRAIEGADDATLAAYDAPYPDARFKAGVRTFPALVPVTPDMPGASVSRDAARYLSTDWAGETFMAVGAKDPVLGPKVMQMMRSIIKGCPEPLVIEEAGHFVQEHGDVVAKAALEAWGS